LFKFLYFKDKFRFVGTERNRDALEKDLRKKDGGVYKGSSFSHHFFSRKEKKEKKGSQKSAGRKVRLPPIVKEG